MTDKPKFIFTLTTGHSGGTLLNLMLGASPKVFAAGECLRLSHLSKLDQQSEDTQAFWAGAIARMSAKGWPMQRLYRQESGSTSIRLWKDWVETIAELSPKPVLADKSLSFKLIKTLCDSEVVNPYFVHLVRDPRAVYYSFYKKYGSSMRQARAWLATHRAIEKFLTDRPNSIKVHYEGLVSQPADTLAAILDGAGEYFGHDLVSGVPSDIATRSLSDPLFENVIFSGNRMRHGENRDGKMIEADMQYLRKLPVKDWLLATVWASPRMREGGYSLGRHAESRHQ